MSDMTEMTKDEQIARLNAEKQELLAALVSCYDELNMQGVVLNALKKNLRRYEVQNSSLKIENDNFKRKFGIIENNFFGAFLLSIYRRYKHFILKYEK